MKRPKNRFPDTRGAVYLWLSQCTVTPTAFWKCVFFGTPCISIWSGSEVSEENFQKCKRATVCTPTWPRLKKQLAVFVFVFVLVFAWGLIFVSVFDFYQKHKRETVCLTPWPMLTMSCLCLSFCSSEALSLSLWLTKSAKEQLCALHLGLDKTSSCLGSTNWQIGQQYFHLKDLLLIGLSFMNMKCASHFDPDQQLFRCEHKNMNM